MKRDMDLIRELLLRIEEEDSGSGDWVKVDDLCTDEMKLYGHLKLLMESGFIDGVDRGLIGKDAILPNRITFNGHDFLDSVRDPLIWQKTKDGAKAAGGFTVELLADLAKGFIKTQIKKQTGIEL